MDKLETITQFTFEDVERPFLDLRGKLEILSHSISYGPIKKTIEEILDHTTPFWDFFNREKFLKFSEKFRGEIVLEEPEIVDYFKIVSDFTSKYCSIVEKDIGKSGIEFFVRTWSTNCDPYGFSYEHLISEGFADWEDGEQVNIATNLLYFIDRFNDELVGPSLVEDESDEGEPILNSKNETIIQLVKRIKEDIDQLSYDLGKC